VIRPATHGDRSRAEAILRVACGDRVRTAFPLAPLTTFRIGGPAALYLEPESEPDLEAVSAAVRETVIPVVVIGKGSNVLVSDEGFPGLVIRLGRAFRWAARDGGRLTAGGSMPLPALAGVALSHSMAGLEFGVAIPATVGGAVRMNAGAHGHSVDEVVESIDVYSLVEASPRVVPVALAGYRYRGSDLPDHGVVIGATFRLRPGRREDIRALMDEAREWRRATQPLAEPNCGSVFKNPPGEQAAGLIDSVGAKGLTVGGASVSTKHANFIVTAPGARAADVITLIRTVQQLVADRTGIHLDPEVHLVGRFDLAPL
jgi:UDP-N-acetylmuramate dehydrogenase